MRIAIVVNRFPAVSETFIFNKVKGLALQGLDVTIITHSSANDMYAYQDDWKLISNRVKIVQAFSKHNFLSSRFLSAVVSNWTRCLAFLRTNYKKRKRITEILRSFIRWISLVEAFDIIHFEYSGLAVTYLDCISHLKPSKIFVSCRGAAEQIKPLVDNKRIAELKKLFQEVDCVHCVSTDMLTTCITSFELDPRKAFVNRPAINVERFKRQNSKLQKDSATPFMICSTGRLHWKKGFEYALLAMRELKDRGHSFTYKIMGGGVEHTKLTFMVHDLGLEDCVVLLGSLTSNEVKSHLEKCDIYLLPSLSEGISNAVLEAMAMELPVVTTSAGGMEEVIVDRVNGLLTEAYQPQQLADSLELLMADETLRNQMATKGKEVIQNDFTLHRQVEIFVQKYNRTLHD